MLSHSYDHVGNVDFRLAKVPAAAPTPSRAVLRMEELDVPREVDSSGASGAVYAQLPGEDSVPIGEVPGPTSDTFGYLEAASGIINDAGVAMAECTCSAIFAALPVDKGGLALLNYAELTRIALERASTAREAIHIMGALAEEFGFFGNSGDEDLGGCAENLAVADTEEAWLFHILPDDSGHVSLTMRPRELRRSCVDSHTSHTVTVPSTKLNVCGHVHLPSFILFMHCCSRQSGQRSVYQMAMRHAVQTCSQFVVWSLTIQRTSSTLLPR